MRPIFRRGPIVLMVILVGLVVTHARAADPEEAQYNVVVSLYNGGNWEAAVKKIDERLALNPPDAMRVRYLYARGLAYERGQKTKDARAAYEEISTKHPGAAEAPAARVAMLYLDYAAGDAARVVEGYAKIDAAKLAAGDKRNLALMYAESLAIQGQAQQAVAAYKTAIAAGADAAPLTPRLFGLYSQLGMHADLLAISGGGITGVDADTLALVRAEAMLTLNQFPQADAEAAKVREASEFYPRASFVRAQSLIRQNKLKEAAAPLEIAVARMKNPPAPPVSHLVLAECLIESGRPDDAAKAVASAERLVESLPEAERAKLRGQAALIKVRLAMASKDRKRIIAAVGSARTAISADQLSPLLYARLFALAEEGDHKAVIQTITEDLPVFQSGVEYGPAVMIYAASYRALKQPDEAVRVLKELIEKKPSAPEAVKARVVIANAMIDKDDTAGAAALLDAVIADKEASTRLGKTAMDEVLFNRAVIAMKLNQHDAAIGSLKTLLATTPTEDIAKQAAPLLGQAYAGKGDFGNAAAAWKAALTAGRFTDEADLRDRLSRALYTLKDYPGTIQQIEAWSALVKSSDRLPIEAREIWARSLFSANRFPEAAQHFTALANTDRGKPGYAYEAAAAFDRAGDNTNAEKWYTLAAKSKAALPAPYAAAVDENLASLRLRTGSGDMGLPLWLDRLSSPADDKAFEQAAASIRAVMAVDRLDASARAKLRQLMESLPVEKSGRYAVGALLLESMLRQGDTKELGTLANALAESFAANERSLDANTSGATVAPAVIYFARGEAARAAQRYTDALVEYETVLSAYPYNEWPDAAACGAAECYAALGDSATAITKFNEVLAVNPAPPASEKWRELAKRRVEELQKEAKP